MPTPALIERQVKLETAAVSEGIAKLRADMAKAEERNYSSSTVYGQKLLKEAIPLLAAEIKRVRTERLIRGKAAVNLAPLVKHTLTIDDETMAMIVLKALFDQTISPKDRANHTNKVIDKVGQTIEAEAKLSYFKAQDPKLFEKITYYQHNAAGLHNREYKVTHDFAKVGIRWESWPVASRVKIGNSMADAAMRITGWWHRETKHNKQSGKTMSTSLISPTPKLVEVIASLKDQADLFAPFNWPMLVEPNDWTNDTPGGYLTNEVRRGNPMVRMFGPSPIQGETPIQFLNHLQKVAYRINPFILEVAEALEEKGHKVEKGKFLPEDFRPLPNKPHDIETNEQARIAYRQAATDVHNHNANAAKKTIRTKLTMAMARRFKGETYYLPWSYDYRGRVYPIPAFLTPQDTCFGKSLVSFAKGEPLTERGLYWLRFQLATTYGLDKATMEERQEWAQSSEALQLIEAVATDPLGTIAKWEEVDEPFLFLAAAEEYYALVIAKTRDLTSLPVAVDATCSGLQVLAGLSHDASTAALVNVSPGAQPSDAYKAVARLVNREIPKEWGFELTRSDVKRVVMTIPYNAKSFSNRSYIGDALRKRGVEITKEQLTELVKLTREAMRTVVPGPLKVMDWLNREIGRAIKNGMDHISWTTPSGFVVKQDLRKTETVRIDAHLMGRVQIKIGVGHGAPDLNHHKNAGAPNLIHSMDSAILQIGLKEFPAPFTCIHDSVLCGANHMDAMNEAVRAAYAQIFVEHSPLHDLAEAISAETPPPMEYTFDPGTVLDSPYFFC